MRSHKPVMLTRFCSRHSYSYFLGLPVLLWAAIKYWAGSSERSPVEIVSLYGYASTVWILVSVRCPPPPSSSTPSTLPLDQFTDALCARSG